jgi:hypothetical protein
MDASIPLFNTLFVIDSTYRLIGRVQFNQLVSSASQAKQGPNHEALLPPHKLVYVPPFPSEGFVLPPCYRKLPVSFLGWFGSSFSFLYSGSRQLLISVFGNWNKQVWILTIIILCELLNSHSKGSPLRQASVWTSYRLVGKPWR